MTGPDDREEVNQLREEIDRLRQALQRIVAWGEAYPPTSFPEPNWQEAAKLLKAGGMSLDIISANCMKHVVKGVSEIARRALEVRSP
jgi:hypothetical protein